MMARHAWGIYLPNEGDPQVDRALDIAGNGCYTILAHQCGKDDALRRLREGAPDALILVRFYLPNWYFTDPVQWAQEITRALGGEIGRYTKHFTWANEQNLALESHGAIGASDARAIRWTDYEAIHAWNMKVLDEFQRAGVLSSFVAHYPGLAYGHGEDWGYDEHRRPLALFPLDANGVPTPAYELLRPGIDRCPVLNVHPYVQRGVDVLDEWRGVRRIERVEALFPGKALFAAETGQFDVRNEKAPDQLVQIGYYLQNRQHVIGFTPFILDSPDPGHAMNNWSHNREIEAAYKRTTRLPRPYTWAAGPTLPDAPPHLSPAPAPVIPPQEKPVSADIVLSVPMRTNLAHPENHGVGARRETRGVVIHTTRGGATKIEREFDATVNWFQNPDAQVSAHLVVGEGKRREVARCLPDDAIGWHARGLNATHLSIEICQPTPDWPVTEWQYAAAAEACTLWAAKFGFPLRRVMSADQPGLVGHEDTAPGKRDHKSDPSGGGGFSWDKFLAVLGVGEPAPAPKPGPAPPAPGLVAALRDRAWALAGEFEAAGYPWTGQTIKGAVALSKGER